MNNQSQTSLTRYADLMRDPNPANAKRAAKDAYNESKGEIVLINRQWLLSWADRKQLEILASKALGVRGLGNG